MIKQHFLVFFALLGAALIILISCSKDKGNQSNARLVSSIDIYYHNVVEQRLDVQYDEQKRIVRLTNTDALGYDDFSSTTTISYPSANIMFITDSYNSQTYTCTLNNDGYIVSLTEGGNEVESLAYTNGYLQKKMMYRSDDDGITLHAGTYTETYTWNNGNVKIIERECNYPTAPELNWSYTSTYEYSAVQNKLSSIDLSRNSFQPLGWYGKPDLNLMSKITDENPWDEDVRTYRYETDQDGYVTNIFVRYNGGSEELMATIQY